MSICDKFLDLLYPPKCMFCGDILRKNETNKICRYCENNLIMSSSANAVFFYSDHVRRCVHNFKYNYHPEYSIYLARYMYAHLLEHNMTEFDLIIPVPMYHRKKRIRGFNHAELLAADLSRMISIPVDTTALVRILNTKPQSTVSYSARFENLKNAFLIAEPDKIKDKRILLVDDIFTSGSTIRHCTYLLLKNNAFSVSFITLASANSLDKDMFLHS